MARWRKWSDDHQRRAEALKAKGVSYAEIGRLLGVSDTTVTRRLNPEIDERDKEQCRLRGRERWANEEGYAERCREQMRRYRHRKNKDPKFLKSESKRKQAEKPHAPKPGIFYLVYSGNSVVIPGRTTKTLGYRIGPYRTHSGPHAQFIYAIESEDARAIELLVRDALNLYGQRGQEWFEKKKLPDLVGVLPDSGWRINQDEILNIATTPSYEPLREQEAMRVEW